MDSEMVLIRLTQVLLDLGGKPDLWEDLWP